VEDARRSLRRTYDEVAETYAANLDDELDRKPLDRALLGALAEECGAGPVADIGCGPGHVAAWFAGRGIAAVGVDLSPGMVVVGHRLHPEVEFRQGDLLGLPADDAEFTGAVAFYSIIHLTPDELVPAMAEIHRVSATGAPVLVSFHVGSEVRHLTEWWGHQVDIAFRYFEPAEVAFAMQEAGLAVEATLVREHLPEEVATRRAYLWARRPGESPGPAGG
jgi:SAM-dependent methyltransferase